ncbi:hypothetical protein [Streptomyces sp. NPDC003877]
MTHFRSKRWSGPGRPGTVVAAVFGLVAALGLGAIGDARAAEARRTAPVADRWSDRPHGFASLAGGTSGGAGGKVVTAACPRGTDDRAPHAHHRPPTPSEFRWIQKKKRADQ